MCGTVGLYGSTNPYLSQARILTAGLDGIVTGSAEIRWIVEQSSEFDLASG